ncbi:MAG: FAD-binding oxidoreductase [Alphaproteobacteria bacterium]|nr:FAD-binding oxidoreductase [Alphaproteobacteria bacterium]
MAETEYPASWYAATRDGAFVRPCLSGSVRADVAVVGGGFAGLHTARLLAERRLSVVLVERRRIGWGASGRNGGFVGAGYALRSGALIERLGVDHARRLYAQSQRGVAIVHEAVKEMARADIVMGWGRLTVSRTDQGADFAQRTRALAEKLGATFEPWDTERVRGLLATRRYHQALHDAQGFHIHPLNFALALAADIERRGVRVHEGSEARALERQGIEWRLRTAMGEVTARHVVLAGNADLGRVHRLAGAVLPVATYVAVTGKLGPQLDAAIRWHGAIGDTRRAGDYYRIVDGDRLLWGGRITTDTREPRRLRAMMRADILAVYPQLGDVAIEYAWPGLMGYALHKMPQVGEIEPGLWACTAFGGHGVAQTAAGADAVAAGIAREDDRWRLFAPFGTGWAGGALGRAATQLVYWRLQASDWWDEKRQARNAETLRS